MNEEIAEYYEELYNLCVVEKEQPLTHRYRQLREALERVMRQQMQGTSLQVTDLAARINYVSTQFALDGKEQNQLHTFRLTSNDILNHRKEPSEQEFLRDLRAVAYAYRKIFHEDIPLKLYVQLPKQEVIAVMERAKEARIRRIRVCFEYADESYLYVRPIDVLEEEPVKVNYNKSGVNEEFKDTVGALWRYLLDISSLAECYKDYGSHPANYFLSRLVPIENARPLLLGNIANLFLDEWIHAEEEEPDYTECMRKAFRQYPIELAACEELLNPQKEKEFAQDCRMHFEHIRETVQETFMQPGYNLDKNDAVLEPSYICEALGIQGRLDYMQRDMSSFIEMKSGKADEYSMQGRLEPKENNRVQMLLYMAVLEYSMEQDRRRIHLTYYILVIRYFIRHGRLGRKCGASLICATVLLLWNMGCSCIIILRSPNSCWRKSILLYSIRRAYKDGFGSSILNRLFLVLVSVWICLLRWNVSISIRSIILLQKNFILLNRGMWIAIAEQVLLPYGLVRWMKNGRPARFCMILPLLKTVHHRLIKPLLCWLYLNMKKLFCPTSVMEMWWCLMTEIKIRIT